MWDLIPSWLADPSAYAQPENLDMTTVIVVALANLFFGLCCLAVYECVRRKTPRTYAPRIQLGHATPPPQPDTSGYRKQTRAASGAFSTWRSEVERILEDRAAAAKAVGHFFQSAVRVAWRRSTRPP